MSAIIWYMVWFLASKPNDCIAALSSFGSIVPVVGRKHDHPGRNNVTLQYAGLMTDDTGGRMEVLPSSEEQGNLKVCHAYGEQIEVSSQHVHLPDPSVSKRLKASRISSISSSLSPGRS